MKSLIIFFIALCAINENLYAAEAGMPQLDPTYWASQAFWLILVFTILYISISKFYLPKIKENLDNRENKIKEDLEDANNFKVQAEKKLKEYESILEKAKKEVSKIHIEAKKILDKDIKSKKEIIEKEIEKEILKAQKQILDIKKDSISSIQIISEDIAANIIENISGEKLNHNSVRATIAEITKKRIDKYL